MWSRIKLYSNVTEIVILLCHYVYACILKCNMTTFS